MSPSKYLQKRPNAPVRLFFPSTPPKTTKVEKFPLCEKWVPPLPFPLLVGVPPLHNYTFIHFCPSCTTETLSPCASCIKQRRRHEDSAFVQYAQNMGGIFVQNRQCKAIPFTPSRQSVAARFSRNDTEYDEIDEGAKEAEQSGDCWGG